jgi:CBS domain-containing protein
MPTVLDILAHKGDSVFSTYPDSSVLDAVQKMNEHQLGALVVMDDDHVAGMFTERDVLRRIVGEGRDPQRTKVKDVMTREVICCEPQADLEDVSTIMQQRRVRHLPICDGDGRLHGLISIGDVNAVYASQQEAQIMFLNEYVYGRA